MSKIIMFVVCLFVSLAVSQSRADDATNQVTAFTNTLETSETLDVFLATITNSMPQTWELISLHEGNAQPDYWDDGKGITIQFKPKGSKNVNPRNPDTLTVWIMSKDYAVKGNQGGGNDMNLQMTPAQEIGMWHKHRVFCSGEPNRGWPGWQAALTEALQK
jgi:hypothetical protein